MKRGLVFGIVGLILGVSVALSLGATVNQVGRYQITGAYGEQFTVYMLDTATGRLWKRDMHGIKELGTLEEPCSRYYRIPDR